LITQISAKLEKLNYEVWIDTQEMRDNMYSKMAEAVEDSDIILVCMSKKYNESYHCEKEVCFASDRKKKLIFLKLEKFTPEKWLGL